MKRPAIYLVLCFWLAFVGPTSKAQKAGETDVPHQAIERTLEGGQTHSYRVVLKAGEYFHVDVDQRGIDVQLTLVGPDGKMIIERDRPNGVHGAESLSFIVSTSGAYQLKVWARNKDSKPGKYQIKQDVPRTPTAQDKKQIEAETAFQTGLQLSDTRTEEAVTQACVKLELAASLWHEMGDRYAEALSLTNLGYGWESLSENNKAAAAHNKALPIYQDLKDKPFEAASLASLSVLNASFQKSDLAVDQYRRAKTIYRELNDADGQKELDDRFREAAEAYLKAAASFLQQQDSKGYEHSLKFSSAAREMYAALEDKKKEAHALVYLGRANIGLGDRPKGLECFQQSLSLHRALHDKEGEAVNLTSIGKVYADIGDKKTALKNYREALSVAKAAALTQQEAIVLINMGRVFSDLGDKQSALNHYNQASPLIKGKDPLAEAAILNNIGGIHSSLGDSWTALEFYKQALQRLNDPGVPEAKREKAGVLDNIGRILNRVGARQKALEYYNQALPLNIDLKDKTGEAATRNGIGSVYDDLGDKKKALEYYQQAYHLSHAAGDTPGEAVALNNIGSAYDDLGEKQKAIEYYIHALPFYNSSGDRDGEANTLSNIMYASQNSRLAIFYGKQSVDAYQQIRLVNKEVDKDLHKTFVKSIEHTYRHLAKQLILEGRLAEAQQVLNSFKDQQYFDFNPEKAKTPLPLVKTRREEELSSVYQAASSKIGSLLSGADEFTLTLKNRTPSTEESARIQQFEADIKTAASEFLAVFKRAEAELGGPPDVVKDKPPHVDDTDQMQKALRDLHKETKQSAVAIYTVVGDDDFWALVITGRDIVPVISRTAGKELTKKAKEFLAQLSEVDERTKTPAHPLADVQKESKELSDLLFVPIASKLKELNIKPDVLMWSLDGGLRYVPVAALYDGKQYLAERYRNVVFTRAEKKRMLSPVSQSWTGWGFYNSKEYSVEFFDKLKTYPALENAQSEVESIFGVPPKPGIVSGKFLSDTEFSKGPFLERLRQHLPLVHIASHFKLVPGDASESFLILGDGKKLTLTDIKAEPDDLFDKVELLTLSACETGAQKERESDGREIDSFAELAQRKGAQAILASLWSVDDQSTSRLMMEFYQKRQSKLTKAEALQRAQRSLLKDPVYSHPYYWSPFILIGNWR